MQIRPFSVENINYDQMRSFNVVKSNITEAIEDSIHDIMFDQSGKLPEHYPIFETKITGVQTGTTNEVSRTIKVQYNPIAAKFVFSENGEVACSEIGMNWDMDFHNENDMKKLSNSIYEEYLRLCF